MTSYTHSPEQSLFSCVSCVCCHSLAVLLWLHNAASFGGFAQLTPLGTGDLNAFCYAAVGDAAESAHGAEDLSRALVGIPSISTSLSTAATFVH